MKTYKDKVKELSLELSDEIHRFNPTWAESQMLFSLKGYIDKRFGLLDEMFEPKNHE